MPKNSEPPVNVTIQTSFVLFITAWNGLRIYSTLSHWPILREFGANPVYLFGTGAFWTLVSLGYAWQLNRGWYLAPQAGAALAGLYFLWYWADRLVIQPSPAPNLLFSSLFSAVILIIFTINLFLPVSKAFFKKE